MGYLIDKLNPDKIFNSNLKVWLDANQVNGFDVALPDNNEDVLVWKNLTGLSDYGKGTGRSNRSPKFTLKEDGANSALRFIRGTSTTSVDADMLSVLTPTTLSIEISYAIVSKRFDDGYLSGLASTISNGISGINITNGYSVNETSNNNFRFNTYLKEKVLTITSVSALTRTYRVKVADSSVVSRTFESIDPAAFALGHIGGYGYDADSWGTNFNIFNPRNFNGLIYEVLVIQGDILDISNVGKLKTLETYFKVKYTL